MTDSAPPLDFYFDFSSPYGYLMSEKIDAVAARHGRKVRWHPILLGIIFKATGSAPLTLQNPAKAAYSIQDFERSARFMGIPYRHPSRFPLATQNAARAYYWLHGQDCGLARQFAQAVNRALFVDDQDISAPETVNALPGFQLGSTVGMSAISGYPSPRISARRSPYHAGASAMAPRTFENEVQPAASKSGTPQRRIAVFFMVNLIKSQTL